MKHQTREMLRRIVPGAVVLWVLAGCATYRGAPPLQSAVEKGEASTVRELLREGNSVNRRGPGGWTALHQAAYEGERDIAAILIEAGADLNLKDNQGFTPLHWAAYESVGVPGARAVAELLVSKGADVNARDKEGSTPLLWSLMMGNPQLAEFLKAHGADDRIPGKGNMTARDFAQVKP